MYHKSTQQPGSRCAWVRHVEMSEALRPSSYNHSGNRVSIRRVAGLCLGFGLLALARTGILQSPATMQVNE